MNVSSPLVVERHKPIVLLFYTLLLVLLAAAFYWTFGWMVATWDREGSYYSHGWLIPPVTIYLLFRKRKEIAASAPTPSGWGLLILIPALFAQLIASLIQYGSLSGFAFVAVLGGLVWTLFGARVLKLVWFPLAFLLFMVPLSEGLIGRASFDLKILAAQVAAGIVDFLGLTVVRTGSYLTIPTGRIVVDNVCSGLKYLISLLAFGALYASLSSLRWRGKLVLFLLAGPVALVANIIRVTLMVLIAYQWGVGVSEKWYFHDVLGFLLFIVAFMLLFLAHALLTLLTRNGEKTPEAPGPGSSCGLPVAAQSHRLRWVSLCMLVPVAVLSLYFTRPRSAGDASETLGALPMHFGEWQGRGYDFDERTYAILGTRDVLSRTYTNRLGQSADLVIVMAQQMGRRTHAPEQCLEGEGYVFVDRTKRMIQVPTGAPSVTLEVNEAVVDRADRMRVIWYFFKNGASLSSSYFRHQTSVAIGHAIGGTSNDILIRVEATAHGRDVVAARAVMQQFLDQAGVPLLQQLP